MQFPGNHKIQRDSAKMRGGEPMLRYVLLAIRAVLYELAVCLLRDVCFA